MLILSRRPGESLLVDGGIRIEILSSDGRTVRLGIHAPSDIRIVRAELAESVAEETRRAAATAAAWAAARPAALSPVSAPPPATPPTTER
jgi:carbon storage regulator